MTVQADRLPYDDDERRGWRVREASSRRRGDGKASGGLQLPAAATSVGQRWVVGKRPSAAARRGSPRARVADGEATDAGAGADGMEASHTRQALATTSGGRFLTAGPWQVGLRGRGVAVRGEEGRRETGASCHKQGKGRVEGSWRMLDRKKHPWTERNEHQNGEVHENGEPPTAGTFLGATSAANPAARRGQAPRVQDRNRNHRFFSSRRDGWSPLFAAVDGPVELIAGPVIAFCFPLFPLCTTNNEGARPRESFSLFPSSHNRLDMESSLFLGSC